MKIVLNHNPIVKYKNRLTPKQFKYSFLYFICEWKMQDIAEHYGCTKQNIWYVINETMKRLKQFCKDKSVFDEELVVVF